ncbi:MAG TPA: DUF1569 domain-containing protein [Terracidiphilus sp.]|nr:DUF1569 domain-containing protein [Terracidiphilus sp.]
MESLFDAGCAEGMKQRLSRLKPDQPRQWGKMNAGQMLAHCSKGLRMATGEIRAPRPLMGRILGPIVKPMALREGVPMHKNSPTSRELVIGEPIDFEAERAQLIALIDRFGAAGAAGCTDHPHPFFGRLTADEWSMLMWKHLDHHLRQFGV